MIYYAFILFTSICQGLAHRRCSINASQMLSTAPATFLGIQSFCCPDSPFLSLLRIQVWDGHLAAGVLQLGQAVIQLQQCCHLGKYFPPWSDYPHCFSHEIPTPWGTSILRNVPLLACSRASIGPPCSKGLSPSCLVGTLSCSWAGSHSSQSLCWELSHWLWLY